MLPGVLSEVLSEVVLVVVCEVLFGVVTELLLVGVVTTHSKLVMKCQPGLLVGLHLPPFVASLSSLSLSRTNQSRLNSR